MKHFWNAKLKQKRSRRIGKVSILIWSVLFCWLYIWVERAIPQAHIYPQVKRADIRELLTLTEGTETDLQILSAQTGLHPGSIQQLLREGRAQELLQIQLQYFAPVHMNSLNTTPLTISEVLVDEQGNISYGMPLVDLQDGDILITKNSRFLGWRNGHAALVVDAEKGFLLEAIMPGTNTKISSISKWSTYPSFQVLRLKEAHKQGIGDTEDSLPEQVADYALRQLTDVPYRLLAGVFDRNVRERENTIEAAVREGLPSTTLKGTQCAHLVWYAYKQFGIDLDSDGGLVVTPCDIQNSDYLETIQTYGY